MKTALTFHEDHDNPKDCQLILAVTGNRKFIEKSLKEIVGRMAIGDKPTQGSFYHTAGTIDVITPVWNGKKY